MESNPILPPALPNLSPNPSGQDSAPENPAPISDSPLLALSVAWKGKRAGVLAKELASVLTGKPLKLDGFSLRADIDLPVSRGRWGGFASRYFIGFKKLDGETPAVTLGELTNLSPGLADLIRELSDTLGLLGEDFKKKGERALSENIADQVQLSVTGADLGIALVSTGPTIYIREPLLAVRLFEFAVGAYGHLSHGRFTVTDHNQQSSAEFLGWGLGGALSLAPVGLFLRLPKIGKFVLQPLSIEAGLFALLTGGDLVAADVYLNLSTRLGYSF